MRRDRFIPAAVWAVLLAAAALRADDQPPAAVKVADDVSVLRATVGGKPVAWFGVGLGGPMYQYEIDFNTKLPKGADLQKALLAALARDKEHRDKIVFSPFAPAAAAPDPVEVVIGRDVPLPVARAVLAELSKADGLKLAPSVKDEDGPGLDTRRVYVGGLVKSGKPAATADLLKTLLDPKTTHAEFLAAIRKAR